MSRGGIILNSILLGIFLLGLLAMSLYAVWVPRWTTQLNAITMICVGIALTEQMPLLPPKDVEEAGILDEMPGWFGDATGGHSKIGKLAIGAKTPLKVGRRYCSYLDKLKFRRKVRRYNIIR